MNNTKKTEITINHLSKDRIRFKVEPFVALILKLKNIDRGFFEFTFVDNKIIKEMNVTHLKKDDFTDVISFNLGTAQDIIGDVYISTEQAKIQAKTFNNSLENELKLLITHAILHLLDYEDYTDSDREIMEEEQNRLLALAQKKELLLHTKQSNIFKSFGYALRGLGFVIATQRNMKIHLVTAVLAIILGFYVKLSHVEWLALLISISLVLMMEAINTAVEISVDLTTRKRKFRAMLSKDVAAASVLIASINALVVAYLVFFDKLVSLFLGR